MPSLAELTDYAPQQESVIPDADGVRRVIINTPAKAAPDGSSVGTDGVGPVSSTVNSVLNALFRDDDKRYQLWPEKVVREALSAAHDVSEQGTIPPGLRREDYTDIPSPTMPTPDSTTLGKILNIAPVASSPADNIIGQGQAMSALAGTGGLAGADASLGSTAFLRPALKFENKIYKAPVGGQHLDALPEHLYNDFQTKAMNGEDINHYNFGFMNHKGQFLDREKALDYAIKEGLVDQSFGNVGQLTSTMAKFDDPMRNAFKNNPALMADSSKPGTALQAMAKTKNIDWNLIKTADDNLTGPAARAIDSWVGGTKDFKANGGMFGVWHPKALKEALKTPEIRAQLDEAMAPIKAHLKAEHGDTIKLYRNHGDLPEGAKPDRELLSFTSDKNFAENGFGAPSERKLIPEEEIKAKEAEFEKTGKVSVGKHTWLEKVTETFDPATWGQPGQPKEITYTAIMRPDGMVTDTPSVRDYLSDINKDRASSNVIRDKKLKNVVSKEIPIDDIIYATDRFGQKEFIVHNKNKNLFSDPTPVYDNNKKYKFVPVSHDPFNEKKK